MVKFKMHTSMRGLQKFMQRHPRKSLKGFFSVDGREMRHEEVVRMVNYAVEKGYETEADNDK